MKAILTLFFFVSVVGLLRAERACGRLVSQRSSGAGYGPPVRGMEWCRDTMAFVCSAGPSPEVNYIMSVIWAQSVYVVSLFSLLL